jgi:hypothetical protein
MVQRSEERDRMSELKATIMQLVELRKLIDEQKQTHEIEKGYMAKERTAIVGWLRRYGGDGHEIAKLIEDGQHWKNQP